MPIVVGEDNDNGSGDNDDNRGNDDGSHSDNRGSGGGRYMVTFLGDNSS